MYATHCGDYATKSGQPETLLGRLAAAIEVDTQLSDFLAQRVAINAEQISRLDLVASCCGHRSQYQWVLNLREDALI
jgi:predicted component of type VI protein secretion system